jgi:hypothetical protein
MVKKLILSAFFALAIGFVASAQPPFDPLNPNPAGIPVDGGVSLLLASGAAFGIKKLRANKEVK